MFDWLLNEISSMFGLDQEIDGKTLLAAHRKGREIDTSNLSDAEMHAVLVSLRNEDVVVPYWKL